MTTTKTIFEENNEKYDNNNTYNINESYIQNSPSHIYNLEGKDDVFEEELSHNSYNLYNTASNTKKIKNGKKLMEDILSEKIDNYNEEIKSGEIVDNFKSINKKTMKLEKDLLEEELSENNNNNIYNIGTNIKRIRPEKNLITISQKSSDKENDKRKKQTKKNKNSINKNKDIIKEIIENKVGEIKNKILTEKEKQIFINMYENNFEEIFELEEASDSYSDDNLEIKSNQKFN